MAVPWPGIWGLYALAELTTVVPTAPCCLHPVLRGIAAPPFLKVACALQPLCLSCTIPSPFTLITYILLGAIKMPNATSSKEPSTIAIPGSWLDLSVTHPSTWEAVECGEPCVLDLDLCGFNPTSATP